MAGQYEPHYDMATREEKAFLDHEGGNRVATLLFYMGKTDAGGATVFIDGGVRLPPTQVSQQRTLHFLSGIVILSLLCLRSPHLIDFLHVKKHVIEFFVCGALKALCVSNVHELAVFICFFSQKMKLFYSFLPPP